MCSLNQGKILYILGSYFLAFEIGFLKKVFVSRVYWTLRKFRRIFDLLKKLFWQTFLRERHTVNEPYYQALLSD